MHIAKKTKKKERKKGPAKVNNAQVLATTWRQKSSKNEHHWQQLGGKRASPPMTPSRMNSAQILSSPNDHKVKS
jgi:hypothetical protein